MQIQTVNRVEGYTDFIVSLPAEDPRHDTHDIYLTFEHSKNQWSGQLCNVGASPNTWEDLSAEKVLEIVTELQAAEKLES